MREFLISNLTLLIFAITLVELILGMFLFSQGWSSKKCISTSQFFLIAHVKRSSFAFSKRFHFNQFSLEFKEYHSSIVFFLSMIMIS